MFRTTNAKNFTAGANYTVRSVNGSSDVEDRTVNGAGTVAVNGTYDIGETGIILAAVFIDPIEPQSQRKDIYERPDPFFRPRSTPPVRARAADV
jgi:hypothetical protein